VARATNNGRKDRAGDIVSGKPDLALIGSVVNNKGWYFVFHD
jgi:hypothetical protein